MDRPHFSAKVVSFPRRTVSTAPVAPVEPLAHLVGEGIQLQWNDRTLSGSVDECLVFADSLSLTFGARLLLRVGGRTHEAVLRRDEHALAATLTSSWLGEEFTTSFILDAVDPVHGAICGTLDRDRFDVQLLSQGRVGNQYCNPTFVLNVAGQPRSFTLHHGSACIGCAIKVIFAVLTVKRHLRVW